MPDDSNQKRVFEFLKTRLLDQNSFSKDEFAAVTTWAPNAFRTYWTKQFRRFMVPAHGANDRYRVAESFRPFITWKKFQKHVTQMRLEGPTAYNRKEYALVRVFEFYMPLTHEHALKNTLNALFYKNVIKPKLRALVPSELNSYIPRQPSESEDSHFERVCQYLAKKFRGYSVYHVDGRFRMEDGLCTHGEAAAIEADGGAYVMDETTAVTRFILLCDDDADAETVWYFFHALFIDTVLQLINGEAEVWMVETGMKQRVWVWKEPEAPANDEEEASSSSLPL